MKTFLLAIRTIKNYPLYTIVNILGLALSLACTIVIARYINGELSVDSAHKKLDNIYLTTSQNNLGTENSLFRAGFMDDTVQMFSDAAVVSHCDLWSEQITVTAAGTPYDVTTLRSDSTMQDILDFPIVAGSQKICAAKNEAAITARFAARVFGNENPIGKTIIAKERELVITSVVGDVDSKSSIYFDLILHMRYSTNWNGPSVTMVLLAPLSDYKEINRRYGEFQKSEYVENVSKRYQLIPFNEQYFDASHDIYGLFAHGDARTISILFIVALAVLTIGIFNFINIYTVLMLRRSREMGLKMVFGAPMAKLLRGIYVENLFMVILSIGIGWILTVAFDPLVVGQLGIGAMANPQFDALLSVCLVLLVPILTSIYPYFKYKYQKPITTIQNVNGTTGRGVSRALFLVAQYIITVVIVVVSIFFVKQLNFMLSSDLGYKYSNVIKLRMFDYPSQSNYGAWDQYRAQMESKSRVVEQSMESSMLFSHWGYCISPNSIEKDVWATGLSVNGSDFTQIKIGSCAPQFFDMFAIPIVWGRGWNDTTDRWNSYKCIVNEAFLREFGIQDPAAAVVQPQSRMWSMSRSGDTALEAEMETNPPYSIVGVMRDFQLGHLRNKIEPIIMTCEFGDGSDGAANIAGSDFCAQIVEGRQREAIEFMEKLYKEVGGLNFNYTMVEDEVAATYAEDRRIAFIYTVFAFIAIVISCLGLFSLSLYDVQRREREIALRRVNGATVSEIVAMLLRKYYGLLLLSFVVAMPGAWFAVDWYVSGFAHRTPLSWWIFVLAAVVTAAISLLTLIIQTVKAARTNPAVAMKRE